MGGRLRARQRLAGIGHVLENVLPTGFDIAWIRADLWRVFVHVGVAEPARVPQDVNEIVPLRFGHVRVVEHRPHLIQLGGLERLIGHVPGLVGSEWKGETHDWPPAFDIALALTSSPFS